MQGLPILLITAVLGAEPTPQTPGPSTQDVSRAIERSLPFLQASSIVWREQKKCVTCHQVPHAIWSLSDAKARGFPVDAGKLDDLTGWAFDFCTTNEHKEEKTGGFHLTSVSLILSQDAGGSPREDALQAYPFFETLFAKRQKPDGSWREGRQIRIPGAEREADEVDTMWTLLAIKSLEGLGEKLPAQTRTALAQERDKALAFLKAAAPGRRIDWLMLRTLVAHHYGAPETADTLLRELRGLQNADGGWGYVRGGGSYPHTTGECLYALGRLGFGEDDPEVKQAWTYLVGSQREDGAWESRSREVFSTTPEKVSDVATHWGTAWATIGLLETLPR